MSSTRRITTRQAATILNVTPRTIARRVSAGTLTPVEVFPLENSRGAFLFDAEEIEHLAAREVRP